MSAGKLKIDPDLTGDDIDNDVVLDASNNPVWRQVIRLAGKTFAALVDVINGPPDGTEYGVVTRPIPNAISATAANQATANGSLASLDGKTVHVDTGAVTIAASALPAGGATAANQATANTSLASLDAKQPALIGGSSPVAIKNPSSQAMGSVAASAVSTALGGSTAYTGGIAIWNSDPTISVFVGHGAITAAAGSGKICLGPGQGYLEGTGDLSAIQIIVVSGTPVINWVGYTL